MVFRKATTEDIPQLVECRIKQLIDEGQNPDKDIKEANIAYFREQFRTGQMEEWVCEDEGRIIATGAVIYQRFPPSFTNGDGLKAYIANIYTDPAYRGRGVATNMLRLLEERARARNVCELWLEASRWGRPVYEKYGFIQDERLMILK